MCVSLQMLIELLLVVGLLALFPLFYYLSYPCRAVCKRRHPLQQTQYYIDTSLPIRNGAIARYPFPSLREDPQVHLSIIVPAYNEEKRILPMLEASCAYLLKRRSNDHSFSFELIVVDDGSKDATCRVVTDFAKSFNQKLVEKLLATSSLLDPEASIRVLKLEHNLGKGGAVQQGILHSRGRYILFADADGATEFSCLESLEQSILGEKENGASTKFDIVIGSRAHLQNEESTAHRSVFRKILMVGFHFVVSILGNLSIRDTQCGFKLFTRQAALACFGNQRIHGWCFDVELLYIASCRGLAVDEISVEWREIDGSKLDIMTASMDMLRDIIVMRLSYIVGWWKIETEAELLANYKPHSWEYALEQI